MFNRGDIIEFDGRLAVIIGVAKDGAAPDDHVAIWFGDPKSVRISEGGFGGSVPEVWTVPVEYCKMAATPEFRH